MKVFLGSGGGWVWLSDVFRIRYGCFLVFLKDEIGFGYGSRIVFVCLEVLVNSSLYRCFIEMWNIFVLSFCEGGGEVGRN